jgi:iron complex outermembrane receptor protein
MKPFDLDAYTTVNAQIAYAFDKFQVRGLFNNIFNGIGYTSYYRGGYINPTDPFNAAAVISYRF